MSPLLGGVSILDYDVTAGLLLQGVLAGMGYGLLAVGFVLVYRSSRFINFAQSAIGAFGAAVVSVFVGNLGVPYWVAFPVGIAVGAGIAGGTELLVVRPLARAPRVLSMVATLGLAQFLFVFALLVNAQANTPFAYPQPDPWPIPEFDVDALRVSPAYSALLVLAPLVVAALVVFLRMSRYGLAIRAAASNPDAAAMAGVSPHRMSTLTWAIAGGLGAFSTTLVVPALGTLLGSSLGPQLLLLGLAPAVIARMRSITVAFVAGILVGVVQQVMLSEPDNVGRFNLVLFVVIAIALLVQRQLARRDAEEGEWTATTAFAPLPEALRRLPTVRALPWVVAALGLAGAIVVPQFRSESQAFDLTLVVVFAIVALSVFVVTGQAGQLSLGQWGFAAVGAVASFKTVEQTDSFVLGLLAAGAVAAVASAIVGIPALRVRGLFLAATTLAFALAVTSWMLQQPWAFGKSTLGVEPGKPVFGSLALDTPKQYYYVALAVLVVCLIVARNVTKGGWGRSVRALRDNEDAARAFTVPARTRKLEAYAVSGLIAGLGGAVYAHAFTTITRDTFIPETAIRGLPDANIGAVAIAVVGGITSLAGSLFGALYIVGIPKLFTLDEAGQAALALGWLVLVLYYPNGIVSLFSGARDAVVDFLARRHGVDPVAARAAGEAGEAAPPRVTTAPITGRGERITAGTRLLELVEVSKRYGGVRAVDGVSLTVEAGEAVGLIGPNGAGKTTLFELTSGFVPVDAGRIHFRGTDITAHAPETRGRLGLIRSFQDAQLFPTLTVEETVMLAQERVAPSRLWQSLLMVPGPERAKRARARDLIHLLGLDPFRTRPVGSLSTGSRRLTEIACLLAVEPEMLLLDEPSAGIAQAETEALGELLARVREELAVTLLVIEHDMPLICGLSDRLVAMELGSVIAEGSPDDVQRDPRVVESYLGGDPRAIARSGSVVGGR